MEQVIPAKRFHGRKCSACGETLRYASNRKCVCCSNKVKHVPKATPKARAANRRHQAAYRAKNPEQHREALREYKLRRSYGLTPECYAALLAEQGGCCAICGSADCSSGRKMAVDHCHKTNKIRGILCGSCNRAIGGLKDDPELIDKAAAYVRHHMSNEKDV
jgi:hypothetical protein